MKTRRLLIPFAFGLGLALGLLWVLHAPGVRLPVARAADLTVCTEGPPACDYATIQAAMDAAGEGDVIKVAAGTYTDLSVRPRHDVTTTGTVTQVLYISKTVTVRGGYTTTNGFAEPPDPVANPTTLDAGGGGRVLYITGDISPMVEGLRITGGDAAGLGGDPGFDAGAGTYVVNAAVTISDTWVFSNTAQKGAGLSMLNSDAILSGNIVCSNTASTNGGGLHLLNGAATLNGNTFISNTASSGGGLFLSDANVSLRGNIVVSNTADWYGGGLDLFIVYSGEASLSGNTFSFNAANTGGGLFLRGSDLALDGNTIIANIAGERGGGLYLSDGSGPTLVNNVIADNQAGTFGSGLLIQDASCHLLHTTVARNSGGDGSGIYVTRVFGPYSTVALTNTILARHTVGIKTTTGNTATLNGVLWYSNTTTNTGGAGVITVINEYTGNPSFTSDGYHLAAVSAAIDQGVSAGVTADIDGDPRPAGTGYDIGADEVTALLEVTKQAYPGLVQAGERLTYTISVANIGIEDLHATVTDILPIHILFGETSGGTSILPGDVLTWTPIVTAPGGVWTETVVVTSEIGYSGPLTNVVRVTTEEGATGVYTATSQAQVTPALSVTKRAVLDSVQAGERLTYTIRITNTGNTDLHAAITDTLPAYVVPSGVLTWTPIITAPGGVWTETVVVTSEIGYSGPLTNVVRVTTEEGAIGTASVTVEAVSHIVYLPLVLRNL